MITALRFNVGPNPLMASLMKIESLLSVYDAWRHKKNCIAMATALGVADDVRVPVLCESAGDGREIVGVACLDAALRSTTKWEIGGRLFDDHLGPIYNLIGLLMELERFRAGVTPVSNVDRSTLRGILIQELDDRHEVEITEDASDVELARECFSVLSRLLVPAMGAVAQDATRTT